MLVLYSLFLQLTLICFGRQRRHNVERWIDGFLWSSYLLAGSVASFTLGVITTKQRNCGNVSQVQNELLVFWASFMLMHLGSQDTITAYSIQDNELWLRQLIVVVVQSIVTLYILFKSWNGKWLSFLTVLMLLVGFIKCAERIWVMRSSISPPIDADVINVDKTRDERVTFQRLRHLFLYEKIHFALREDIQAQFVRYEFQQAFERIEIELRHAYDYFYTKTPLFWDYGYSYIFRCLTSCSIAFVFVFFILKERHKHQSIDFIITYVLLGGAVVIEIYAMILQISSDKAPRWSNSLGQFNMISFCSKIPGISQQGTPKFSADLTVQFFSRILPKLNTNLEMSFYMTHKRVSDQLKKLVWDTILAKSSSNGTGFSEHYKNYISLDNSVHVEIPESIIIWHLATELCYYTDNDRDENEDEWKVIKEISDYMMYILAFCPSLLSAGSASYTFQTSCRKLFFVIGDNKSSTTSVVDKLKSQLSQRAEFSKEYLVKTELLSCANQVVHNLREKEQKRKFLTKFWIENLAHVATLCRGTNHAQQLARGGEFLTHVWFLIEHLDLKENFRMPEPKEQIPPEDSNRSTVVYCKLSSTCCNHKFKLTCPYNDNNFFRFLVFQEPSPTCINRWPFVHVFYVCACVSMIYL